MPFRTPIENPGRARRIPGLSASGCALLAAVLADLLNLHTTTAAKWVHEAGGAWSRYVAQIARSSNHQP